MGNNLCDQKTNGCLFQHSNLQNATQNAFKNEKKNDNKILSFSFQEVHVKKIYVEQLQKNSDILQNDVGFQSDIKNLGIMGTNLFENACLSIHDSSEKLIFFSKNYGQLLFQEPSISRSNYSISQKIANTISRIDKKDVNTLKIDETFQIDQKLLLQSEEVTLRFWKHSDYLKCYEDLLRNQEKRYQSSQSFMSSQSIQSDWSEKQDLLLVNGTRAGTNIFSDLDISNFDFMIFALHGECKLNLQSLFKSSYFSDWLSLKKTTLPGQTQYEIGKILIKTQVILNNQNLKINSKFKNNDYCFKSKEILNQKHSQINMQIQRNCKTPTKNLKNSGSNFDDDETNSKYKIQTQNDIIQDSQLNFTTQNPKNQLLQRHRLFNISFCGTKDQNQNSNSQQKIILLNQKQKNFKNQNINDSESIAIKIKPCNNSRNNRNISKYIKVNPRQKQSQLKSFYHEEIEDLQKILQQQQDDEILFGVSNLKEGYIITENYIKETSQ